MARGAVMNVLALHPDDLVAELVSMRGEIKAANAVIAEQSAAINTAHSALIAGNVDYAIEILAGTKTVAAP